MPDRIRNENWITYAGFANWEAEKCDRILPPGEAAWKVCR